LQTSARGGPYHLINATLNLVAARDLATAQRSATVFTFSKLFCGSPRTDYRPTTQYMGGSLSLGTAVALSGAAASPNMGSISVSGSLAMLMTLLNIRLGYWAPTPNQGNWLRPQARLWPVYLLCEFLSQTNDLFSYCYLTDGGHFENVGLYALVARGCRYILVADCGAARERRFSDLGEAIRRCRIDFDAEIEFDIAPLMRESAGHAARHCVAGTIMYSERHVQRLGWPDGSEAARTGVIVVVK